MDRIKVLLVDDQALLRLGFRMIVGHEADMEVVGEAPDGRVAVTMAGTTRPDVVLMDVRMPVMDGIAATAELLAAHPEVKVIILTTFDLDEYVVQGLRAGASGFLLKDTPPADLVAAIRTVHGGQAFLAPEATRRLLDVCVPALPAPDGAQPDAHAAALATLTDRENAVLAELAAGLSNREIGAKLYIAEGTVKIHVGRILAKLGLRDRVQAVILAYEAGVVRPGAA
ncbi:response regulator transcription factor [Nakamurella flavida]|uniref:Response regulator transcription factor n=1 Tax=Nakamurella flavida TaxID=363630 RepID=A0A938YMG0_9ACTN|nr:response regulator transcription factor [Nakamurella flavida]